VGLRVTPFPGGTPHGLDVSPVQGLTVDVALKDAVRLVGVLRVDSAFCQCDTPSGQTNRDPISKTPANPGRLHGIGWTNSPIPRISNFRRISEGTEVQNDGPGEINRVDQSDDDEPHTGTERRGSRPGVWIR